MGKRAASEKNIWKRIKKSPLPVALISALAVLAVAMLFFMLFYNHIYKQTVRNEKDVRKRHELSASVGQLDEAMRDVGNAIIDAANIPSVRTFMGHRGDYDTYHEIMQQLMLLKAAVPRAFSMWAVFVDEGLVITSNEGYSSLGGFYDSIWTTYEDTQHLIGSEVHVSRIRTVRSPAFGAMKLVSFIKKVEMYGEGAAEQEAYIILNMKLDDMIMLLQLHLWDSGDSADGLMITDNNWKYIYDSTGLQGFIPADDFESIEGTAAGRASATVNGETYGVIFEKSSILPWKLFRFQKAAADHSTADLMIRVVITAMALGLIISFLIVVVVYRRIFVPYRRIIRRLERDENARIGDGYNNEMDYVEGMIAKAVSVQERVERSTLEHALFFPIDKDPPAEDELLSGSYRLTVFVLKHGGNELSGYAIGRQELLEEIIQEHLGRERAVLGYEKLHLLYLRGGCAVITEGTEAEDETFRQALERVLTRLADEKQTLCVAAFSEPQQGLGRLHPAYLQVLEALKICYSHPGVRTAGFGDIRDYEMKIYTPNPVVMDMFRKHLNVQSDLMGRSREALENIRTDVRRCSEGCILTNLRTIQDSMFDYLNDAARRMNQTPDALYETIRSYGSGDPYATADEAFDVMNAMIGRLEAYCLAHPQEKKMESRTQMVEYAVSYIREHYAEGLSLSEIAGSIGVDETYLSRIFKEKMDCTFVQYVTRLRLDKAKELLMEGKMTQTQIAEEVGLGNAQNFIRTFKKYEGVTPGTWRKEQLRSGG